MFGERELIITEPTRFLISFKRYKGKGNYALTLTNHTAFIVQDKKILIIQNDIQH